MLTSIIGVLYDGFAYGMLLFVLSVGLSVTLGMMNFVNLAHGSFAMLGGYVCVVLMSRLGVPFLLTLPAAFVAAGADIVTVHAEAAPHLHRLLAGIREQGARAGVSLNPSTPLAAVEEVLEMVDLVLIMTVNPGFGGQQFIPAMADKIGRVKELLRARGLTAAIEADGGINPDTARLATAAGAEILVAGSAVYGAPDAAAAIRALRGS